MIVKFPRLLTDTRLSNVLDSTIFQVETGELQQIIFDFSDTQFIRPIGLLTALAMMKYSKHKGIANEYCIIEGNSSVSSYLERIDFYKHFNIQKNTIQRHNREDRLVEIQEIETSGQGHIITEKILKIIEKQVPIDKELHSAIAWAIGETIDNIEHHSQSEINGYVCAQTYQDSLEIAIVDCGIGIRKALGSNEKYQYIVSHDEAIRVATAKNTTSRPDNNSGIGLFVTKRILTLNKGMLLIMSGDSLVRFLDGSINPLTTGVKYWQGTLVGFRFNLQVPVNITEQIYKSEFPQDSFDDLNEMF